MKSIRRSRGWSIYLSLCLSLAGFYVILAAVALLVMGVAHLMGAGAAGNAGTNSPSDSGISIEGGIIVFLVYPLLWRLFATLGGSIWKDSGVVVRALIVVFFGVLPFLALLYDCALKLVAVRVYQGDQPISYAILSGGPRRKPQAA